MKAKDLMIGDLINGFGVVRRVTSINGLERPEDDGLLTTMVPGCEFPESNLSFRPCYAQPIPLTGGILEKNGFVYDYDNEECVADYTYIKLKGYQYKEDSILIDYCNRHIRLINDTTNAEINMDINYVHELQHALRLCGIEKEITI